MCTSFKTIKYFTIFVFLQNIVKIRNLNTLKKNFVNSLKMFLVSKNNCKNIFLKLSRLYYQKKNTLLTKDEKPNLSVKI